MSVKVCTKCGIEKPLSDFHNSRHTNDGKTYDCAECRRRIQRVYRGTPTGVYAQIKNRITYSKTHNSKTYKGYTRGGENKTLFISQEDFSNWYEYESKICHYCGLPENLLKKSGDPYNKKLTRLTVDCKDNNLGYIKDNLVLSCGRCNVIKSDLFTYDEMMEIGRLFVKPKWKKREES